MRRISGRSVALALTLAAFASWSGRTFARDVEEGDNPKSATGEDTSWSSDLEGSNQNQNQNAGNRQNRNDNTDSQHHAVLGVSMDDADGAVHVTAVMPGSPAAKAGVQVGDEIRSVDGDRIRTAQGLAEEIGEKRPGNRVELSIRRNGERKTLQVRLATQQELYGRNWRSNRGGFASNDEGQNRNAQNGQYNRSRTRASSYDPDSGNNQSLQQQVRSLQQQVAQLQRELDELRQQNGNARVSSRDRSRDRTQDGND